MYQEVKCGWCFNEVAFFSLNVVNRYCFLRVCVYLGHVWWVSSLSDKATAAELVIEWLTIGCLSSFTHTHAHPFKSSGAVSSICHSLPETCLRSAWPETGAACVDITLLYGVMVTVTFCVLNVWYILIIWLKKTNSHTLIFYYVLLMFYINFIH